MAAARVRREAKLKRQRDLVKKFREQAIALGYAPKPQKKADKGN
jgi:hypothetical protein